MTTGVLVTAAGLGLRLDAGRPKALVEVCGRPLIAHCVARLHAAGVGLPLVLAPAGHVDAFVAALDAKDTPVLGVIAGGVLRRDSVEIGVAALPAGTTRIVVHDAARAFTPPEVIAAALNRVTGDVVAAAPALTIADTVKQVDGENIVTTVNRDSLRLIHTPQVFTAASLRAALDEASDDDTDELGPLERLVARGAMHGKILTVPSSVLARKVTTDEDVAFFTRMIDA